MKKKRPLFLVAVCIPVAAAVAAFIILFSGSDNEGVAARFSLEIFGNANMDESVDESDLEFIRKIIEGRENPTPFADANRDGVIDEKDMAHVAGIINGTAPFIWMLDGNGDPVKVNLPVTRLGVEYLGNMELVRILGVEDKVAAVDYAPNRLTEFYLPGRAGTLADLGNMHNPDYEFVLGLGLSTLLAFGPDIEIKRRNLPGVDVIFLGLYWPDVIHPEKSRFLQGVLKAGYIFGKNQRARDYADWLLEIAGFIGARTRDIRDGDRPNVLMTGNVGYFQDSSTTEIRAFASIDPLSQMCLLAGGRPIAADLPGWTGRSYFITVDPEWVLEKDPDYVFLHVVRYTFGGGRQKPAYGYDVDETDSLKEKREDVMSRSLMSGVRAFENGNVYIIAGDFRNNGMGGILGAAYLSVILHPGLFEDMNPREIHQDYISRWLDLDYDLASRGAFLYPPAPAGSRSRKDAQAP